MVLLFTEDYTSNHRPALETGVLSLTKCVEGWYCEERFELLVSDLGWEYTSVSSITPVVIPI